MKIPKPMLAGICDPKLLKFPVYASPKIDGIRAISFEGQAWSRSGKLIPNREVQEAFLDLPDGLDGELVLDSGTFQDTTSYFMSPGKTGQAWSFEVFDVQIPEAAFGFRLHYICSIDLPEFCKVIVQNLVRSEAGLSNYEEWAVGSGYEGVMVRDPLANYKHGRSTTKGGELLKLKRFTDGEARVVGFVERMHNDNEKDENGKRGSSKAGKRPAGDLGALIVRDVKTDVEFEIGTGFTAQQRIDIWLEHKTGQLVKYKWQECGTKDKPRSPVFLGFRAEEDMCE